MFGRRRHEAPVAEAVAAPLPELTPEQIFELVNSKLADLIGVHGAWTLVRRTDADTDRIFHTMLAHQISVEITQTLIAERSALRGEETPEPAALAWMPEPITVWAEAAAVVVEEEPIADLLDTTDTDVNEVVPTRHSADDVRLVA